MSCSLLRFHLFYLLALTNPKLFPLHAHLLPLMVEAMLVYESTLRHELYMSKICIGFRPKSPHWGLNPGPSVYKTDALPLSYRGSDAKRYIGRLQTHTISTSFSSLPMHARILGGEGEQRKAKEEQGTREEQ